MSDRDATLFSDCKPRFCAMQARNACLQCAQPNRPYSMSIKSDRWIRRMAEQHGMIDPFEPGQIRHSAAG